MDSFTKSQQLLYQIIKKLDGVDDKTKLAKLQYFADFIFYAFNDTPISEDTNVYQRRKQGPLSILFNSDLRILKESGVIDENPQFNFSVRKDIPINFSEKEDKTIDYVIERYGKLSYEELMHICHEQIPYISSQEGGIVEFFTAYNLVEEYPDYAQKVQV